MKAVRIHGPRQAAYEDRPKPEPEPGEVVVRVKAAGICGTDLEIFEGTAPFILNGATSLPFTPGHEWSGEVVSCGPAAPGFKAGDRVTGECSLGCGNCSPCLHGYYHLCKNRTETGILGKDGAFADYIVFPARYLHRANDCSFEELALAEPAAVAFHAVTAARVTPADTVVVMGPGPIGLLAAQCAGICGARQVIVTGTRDERLSLALRLGADATVNVKKERTAERIMTLTGGNGADVIIEAAGTPSVWPAIESAAAPRCRIIMTGLFGGRDCRVNFDPVVLNNISITGCVGSPGVWPETIDLILREKLKVWPLLSHELPLEDFRQGFELAAGRQDGALKILLKP